jgi:hypothetical protein
MGVLKVSFCVDPIDPIDPISRIRLISPINFIIECLYGNNMKYRLDELQLNCYSEATTATLREHFVAVETSNLKEKKKEAYCV